MALINYDDYTKESKEFYAQKRQQAAADKGALFDQQTKTVNDNYDFSVAEAGKAYDESHRENAIQKLINERMVAENNANMGTTNSGLNRTQQTAVQLSYANQKAALDRQKQSQFDTIKRDRATALSDIAANRQAAIDSINQYYDGLELDRANSRYNTDVTAETERINEQIKAQKEIDLALIEAAQNISKINYGELASSAFDSNGNVIYRDTKGNTVSMKAGSNPFTGSINKDVLDKFGEYDPNKVFSNGYQPNNINGTTLKKYKSPKGKNIPETFSPSWRTDGKEQSIWVANGKTYAWDGEDGKYYEVKYTKEKGWHWA